MNSRPELQPTLIGELVHLKPLKPSDFEALYQVASDPLIWEQHPARDRYQRPVFEKFFEGALKSGGAFLITDAKTGRVIGSSRYDQYDANKKQIEVGYTFLSRDCWGHTYNKEMKRLMLNHIFQWVDSVIFVIGAHNLRSQIAVGKIGGVRNPRLEKQVIPGEKASVVFEIKKENWISSPFSNA